MINVGFYYEVKRGFEKDFENKFREVLSYLKANADGFIDAKLYKNVDDPSEYLIYSVWKDLESFKKFISSNAYRSTINYGKSIIESRPIHRILQEVNE
ncbi:antibiotic biosynthesis monooxygenase [Sulfolobus sp. E5-1-F]|uniref:antibiotic biosynthesis monooxygenase family protein n=1 Tax=Saccharolobus sp. E5-1-F TaxID=2663019 RepID=UPI001294AAAB|nr:antibiotic biosynthesis monooxygenase [Sulfolobus sp. E5-1-F]QGA53121.1 antibiotic biosynthesis monooxygenase [Sulfolobus sp. E5-1-F]